MRLVRLSIRKIFVYFLAVASCILLALNIHQRTQLSLFTPNNIHSAFHNSNNAAKRLRGATGGAGGAAITDVDSRTNKLTAAGADDLTPAPLLPEPALRPWYMLGGQVFPEWARSKKKRRGGGDAPQLFPGDVAEDSRDARDSDRIVSQLMSLPPEASVPKNRDSSEAPLKTILLWNGIQSWGGLRQGRGVFLKEKCPVSTCAISSSRLDAQRADLVLFKDHFTTPTFSRPTHQLWMMYLLECPLHTQMFRQPANVFNWTATYRTDSTIVAPYAKWQYFDDSVTQLPLAKNYAANKTKAVAWFVSNCGARNGRLKYAKELGKHIQVDIYGACGTKTCPRSQANNCFKMLDRDYKFYLAFENSNCRDYITEKLFLNGLGQELLPIVMGARPEDYAKATPYKSYIHVDDFDSPKELAQFLKQIDEDDQLYNDYFRWKGTGEFINTKFFCRVCSMLHEPRSFDKQASNYADFNEWWRGKGTCINGNWRKYDKALQNAAAAATKDSQSPGGSTSSSSSSTTTTTIASTSAAVVSSPAAASISDKGLQPPPPPPPHNNLAKETLDGARS